MKIEELFGRGFTEEECKSTRVETKTKSRDVPRSATSKMNADSKINTVTSTKTKPRSESKSRRCRSKMRLDQVSRHEEHSYLLDAETNQAIIDNAVSKDELCRYLTPLKFIEIDSWRKEVPYGLTQESETERRKWRTPLEILLGKADPKLEGFNNTQDPGLVHSASSNTKRQNSRRKGRSKEMLGESAAEQNEQQNNQTTRRPATSPDRQAILKRMKNEKLLLRRQNSAVVASTHKDDPKINVRTESKLYSSYEGLHVSGSYYNRPPISSAPSLRRAITASQERRVNSLYGSTDNKFSAPSYKFSSTVNQANRTLFDSSNQQTNHTTTVTSLQSQFRPRTRGGNDERHMPYVTTPRNTTISTTQEHTSQLRPRNSLQSVYSDPNVAYAPPSPRRSRPGKKNSVNLKVLNYYEAAQNHKAISNNYSRDQSPRMQDHNEHVEAKVVKEPISLPRTSLFSSNQSSPRQGNISSRMVFEPNQLLTSGRWTSKPSAWVAQALPDLTNSDVMAKADRDGYYIRKPSKAVTFKLREQSLGEEAQQTHRRNDDANVTKNDISMVVVNVDEPKKATRSVLSRGGAAGIRSKTNAFVNGNIISVRP